MANESTATKKTVTVKAKRSKRLATKSTKTARPPRIVRQLARFGTRLERMAARALVLKDRAAQRQNAAAAVAAHERAHGVLVDAKQRIEQIAKEVTR